MNKKTKQRKPRTRQPKVEPDFASPTQSRANQSELLRECLETLNILLSQQDYLLEQLTQRGTIKSVLAGETKPTES